jgi:hypothetical protein
LGTGYVQTQVANPYIKWEAQEQWNFGLDLGFINDRINLVVDLYDKTANDMLMQLQLPTYLGSRGNSNTALQAPWGNYGTINNKGLEISLNTRNLTGDFKWETDLQLSFNKNKLVALQGTDASAIEGYGQWSDIISRTEIGGPLYEFYGYQVEGIYQSQDDIEAHLWGEIPSLYGRTQSVFVGDIKFKDIDNDGKITSNDRTSIGSPLPKFTYGINNTFSWKDFDFTFFLQGSYGNKVFNALGRDLTNLGWWTNQLQTVMDYAHLEPIDPNITYPRQITTNENTYPVNNWYDDITNVKISNPGGSMPRAGRDVYYNNQRISDRYLEDGSYLRVKNIVLGYTLPKRWAQKVKIENLRVHVNIQNLWTFTKYTGYDPEVGVNPQDANGFTFGFDQGRYPAPRLVSFGINLSF